MRLEVTAVFEKVPEGFIAWVPELPGANTQGRTPEEARANLEEAVLLVLETNRMLADQFGGSDSQIRETLLIQRREAA